MRRSRAIRIRRVVLRVVVRAVNCVLAHKLMTNAINVWQYAHPESAECARIHAHIYATGNGTDKDRVKRISIVAKQERPAIFHTLDTVYSLSPLSLPLRVLHRFSIDIGAFFFRGTSALVRVLRPTAACVGETLKPRVNSFGTIRSSCIAARGISGWPFLRLPHVLEKKICGTKLPRFPRSATFPDVSAYIIMTRRSCEIVSRESIALVCQTFPRRSRRVSHCT